MCMIDKYVYVTVSAFSLTIDFKFVWVRDIYGSV